jgi:nitrite reductase/ring-hydroxylating ferredoxin subunit
MSFQNIFQFPFLVRKLYFLLFVILISAGCKKEEPPPEIPNTYVNFTIDPNGTQYINLNVVNGWETVTGGYKGILIFRKSTNEFVAFERACPHDPQVSGAQVRVETSGVTCVCPSCASKYILTDGTPFEGPSRYPLKQYTTYYDGVLLHVTN